MTERDPRWGVHYAAAFELLKTHPTALAEQYQSDALRFAVSSDEQFQPQLVEDPLPYQGGPLTLTPRTDDRSRPFAVLLAYAETLARAYKQALKQGRSLTKPADDV
jgi:hypothetical protein